MIYLLPTKKKKKISVLVLLEKVEGVALPDPGCQITPLVKWAVCTVWPQAPPLPLPLGLNIAGHISSSDLAHFTHVLPAWSL